MQNTNKTWIEISSKNLIHNFSLIQKIVGDNVKVAAVVKANAYGHGLKEVVRILKPKVDFFVVDSIEEARTVRSMSRSTKILVIGYTAPGDIPELVEKNISFAVYDQESLMEVFKSKHKRAARIHLKVETGLNRLGFNLNDLKSVLKKIKASNKIVLEGVYTHLANVEDTKDPSYTNLQLRKFNQAIELIHEFGLNPEYVHAAATGAAIIYPDSRFSMVRLGIGLYGLWPSEGNRREGTPFRPCPKT